MTTKPTAAAAVACLAALVGAFGPLPSAAALSRAKGHEVSVTLTDAGCPEKLTAKPGDITFSVKNDGADAVSEFEVLEGHKVRGEKENLAPGLSGSFSVTLPPGTYTTYCPGGDREHGMLIVTGTTGGSAPSTAPATSSKVAVRLSEYTVTATPSSALAGTVRFRVKNVGTKVHEFVVVRGSAATVTTAADGSAVEGQIAKTDAFGELEDLKPKNTATLTAKNLTPGTYVLFCNVVDHDGGTTTSHFAEGMHAELTVR